MIYFYLIYFYSAKQTTDSFKTLKTFSISLLLKSILTVILILGCGGCSSSLRYRATVNEIDFD